ncbi:hypothetical protein N866_00990 [Actinotalea ferrariae CF5-4]|uniref:Uncharacterized protein n=1 Tax=Actinotalea ferrariae CF5-4 TaxID=948458 RepID=A0A021VWG2_9CELL|nr:hypothetical protein N866_00990 [Actinotalea ferrariae CF5-4]
MPQQHAQRRPHPRDDPAEQHDPQHRPRDVGPHLAGQIPEGVVRGVHTDQPGDEHEHQQQRQR